MNELSFIDSLFNDFLGGDTAHTMYQTAYATPKVDVKEEEGSYSLEMELPGRSENDVNIELDKDMLTISSKKEEKKEDKKEKKTEKYILRERRCSSFSRRFTLPSDVNPEEITANFKNGVLTINMQKKAIEAPKRIAIEAC